MPPCDFLDSLGETIGKAVSLSFPLNIRESDQSR
jgi:hypothetical protein